MDQKTEKTKARHRAVRPIRICVDDIAASFGRVENAPATAALAASIARHGLLQPVVVRNADQKGKYLLVCGGRRVAACRLLGKRTVEALLADLSDEEAAACRIEEHLTHCPPHFLAEAEAMEETGFDRAAACFALDKRLLLRRRDMLDLPQSVRQIVRRFSLSLEQTQALLGIDGEERQFEAVWIIAERGLSAQQARRLAAAFSCAPAKEESGRRRMMRMAFREADLLVERLRACGISASVSLHSQDGGLCIRIALAKE